MIIVAVVRGFKDSELGGNQAMSGVWGRRLRCLDRRGQASPLGKGGFCV